MKTNSKTAVQTQSYQCHIEQNWCEHTDKSHKGSNRKMMPYLKICHCEDVNFKVKIQKH